MFSVMQSATRIVVSACLITSALATIHQNSAKLRRDGVLNLYPFPRVGRGSVQQTWELPFNDLYLEYRPGQKRQLYAFPRVGRGEALHPLPLHIPSHLEQLLLERSRLHTYSKRGTETTDSNGMWFGPRLGRSFKQEMETEMEKPIENVASNDVSEPELVEQTESTDDRKKRQAE